MRCEQSLLRGCCWMRTHGVGGDGGRPGRDTCLQPLEGLSEKPCGWTLSRNSINTEASDLAAEMLFLIQEAVSQETKALEKVLAGTQGS